MKYIGVLSFMVSVATVVQQLEASKSNKRKSLVPMTREDIESRGEGACADGTRPLILSDPSGWFASPNFPYNYPNDAHCEWLIQTQQPNQIIRLDFNELRTESGYDTLRIYDGQQTSAPPIALFDGVQSDPVPSNIRSSGPSLLVVLLTDYSIVNSGFNVTYTVTAPTLTRDPCYSLSRPVLLEDYNGTFQSPGYSVTNYWNYADCSWLIESQEVGGTVQLSFNSFATEALYDVVWIYDGQSTAGHLIGVVHGDNVGRTNVPTTYRSTTPYMYIHFTSDFLYSDVGFRASYRSLPGRPTASTTASSTTTATSHGACGSILRVSPAEAMIAPGYDVMCHLQLADADYMDTICYNLIQQLPGIGNASSLVSRGGNFGCLLSTSEGFDGAERACYDNYQWLSTLNQCYSCPYLFVCIRLPKQIAKT